jgi:hypothetical protein
MIYPFYGQATMNNGVISYHQLISKVLNNKNRKPTILIHSNNQNIVYLETPFYLKDGHGATSVLQSEKLNKINQIFIIASIDKVIKYKYSYNKKATKIELKNTVIKLPTKNNKIDFEFMESFISELDADSISKLDDYLLDSDLKDYTLTTKEKQVLNNFKNDKFKWGELKLNDLFDSSNGNFDIKKEHINENGDYVITSGLTNNGILGKTNISAKIFNKNTITIDMFGFAFYRNFKYKMVTHARVFSLKTKFEISKNQGLFLSNSFHFLNKKFGYDNMCNWAKVKSEKIKLPIKNNQPDYEIMEILISAIQKIVIKDVVLYTNKKVDTYINDEAI